MFIDVMLQADVEESPDISVEFSAPLNSTVHNQSLYHPCVQIVDNVTPIMKSNEADFGSRKLRFCPPTNEFALCHYKVNLKNEDEFPVKAFYQMKVYSVNSYTNM